MDNYQQQRMNEAARQFTDALMTPSKASANRTVEAQQLGARLTERFFNTVIDNLRTQAEGTRRVTQQLANQQQRAQEATWQLTRASTDTYKDFLDSMFFFYQEGKSRAKIRIEEAERRAQDAERRAEEAEEDTKEAKRRAEKAARSTEDVENQAQQAQGRVEEAERGFEKAQRRATEAKRRAQDAEKRTEEAEGRSQEADRRVERAEKNTQQAESRAEASERRAEGAEKRAEQAESSVEEAERRLEEAERRVKEFERRAEEAESRTQEAQRHAEETGRDGDEASSGGGDDLPLADYDSLNVRQIRERLDRLNAEEIERLRDYEVRNKDRRSLVNRFNSRLEDSSR